MTNATHFAIANSYATETSFGFANTDQAFGFTSKAARDEYVAKSTKQGTRACTKREALKLAIKERDGAYVFDGEQDGLIRIAAN